MRGLDIHMMSSNDLTQVTFHIYKIKTDSLCVLDMKIRK